MKMHISSKETAMKSRFTNGSMMSGGPLVNKYFGPFFNKEISGNSISLFFPQWNISAVYDTENVRAVQEAIRSASNFDIYSRFQSKCRAPISFPNK